MFMNIFRFIHFLVALSVDLGPNLILYVAIAMNEIMIIFIIIVFSPTRSPR